MSDDTQPAEPDAGTTHDDAPEPEWRRRRRLDAVFGDVLPDTTSDEREGSDPRAREESSDDQWLRAQVPPHHG